MVGGPVPHLGGPRRGQDAPGAGVRPPPAECRDHPPGRRRLPDDPAHPPVGGRRGAHGPAPRARRGRPAPAHRLLGRRGHLCARGRVRRALGHAVHPGHARHRRRGPPPGRGARVGRGLPPGLRQGAAPAAAVGHAVPLGPVRDPRRALRRRRRDARRVLQLRRRGPRPHLPPGHVHPLRRRAAVAQRRGARRGLLRGRARGPRGRPPLSHCDLDRPRRRPPAHPRPGPRPPGGGARRRAQGRRRPRRHRRLRACARGRQGAAGGHRRRADRRAAHRHPGRAAPAGVRALHRPRGSSP